LRQGGGTTEAGGNEASGAANPVRFRLNRALAFISVEPAPDSRLACCRSYYPSATLRCIPMPNVKPKTKPFCVNLHPGKHSYITLINPDNTFTSSTKIGTVQDTTYGYEWNGKVSKWKPSEIRVRLKALPKTKAKDKVSAPPPPDGGTLTVTISMPVKPVDPVPVDYVDDDETP
jgi:hypothetical protein